MTTVGYRLIKRNGGEVFFAQGCQSPPDNTYTPKTVVCAGVKNV